MQPINRRRFLEAAGLSAVALAAPAGKMRMGLVTYQWGKDMSLPELLRACEQAGMLGVELRTEHAHRVEPALSKAERAEVRKRFADSPVKLVGYGANCEYHSPDPAKLKQNIEQTKEYIQLMHDCGGAGVKVKPNNLPDGVPREKTIAQIGAALNEVGAYAAGLGQKLRVEVHGRLTSEIPVFKAIFDVATHKNVYACWNSNSEDLKDPGLVANFNALKTRLGDTVHVRELDGGDYPYAQLIKLFRGISYQGWILMEGRADPKDKVQAMRDQVRIFEAMLRES